LALGLICGSLPGSLFYYFQAKGEEEYKVENVALELHPPEKGSMPGKKPRFTGPFWWLWWYLEWALPGLGMFSEAYIIFCK
jgi:hypothetical protein